MITFIHTADIHFGMENYGKIDATTGIHSRLLDFEKALNNCIDFAIDRSVDFFLFSGDAYKTAHPSPTQQKLLMRCLLRLYKAHIPVVIIVGNHDNPLSFGKASSLEIFGDLPFDGFHVIDSPTILSLKTKNGSVQIVGIPWPTRNSLNLNTKHLNSTAQEITEYISAAVSSIVKDYAQKLNPDIPSVLAGHLTVSSGIFSGSEKRAIYGNDPVLMPSELAIEPFDYVALGHLHRYQDLNPKGYPALVYAGSIERIDFGERKEPKGFCYVQLKRNATTHQFIEGIMRPFIQIEAHLSVNPESHTQELINEIQKHSLDDAVVKILYHVPPGIAQAVDTGAIQRACAHAQYIVGIFPLYKPSSREKRVGISKSQDLETLLNHYFEEKPTLRERKELLTKKAVALMHESKECIEETEE